MRESLKPLSQRIGKVAKGMVALVLSVIVFLGILAMITIVVKLLLG